MEEKYHAFIKELVALTPGGPDYLELIAAIENGTVNYDSVDCLLNGFEFESYSAPPKKPWSE